MVIIIIIIIISPLYSLLLFIMTIMFKITIMKAKMMMMMTKKIAKKIETMTFCVSHSVCFSTERRGTTKLETVHDHESCQAN
jgi:type IV secretory pathway VirB3-like protein